MNLDDLLYGKSPTEMTDEELEGLVQTRRAGREFIRTARKKAATGEKAPSTKKLEKAVGTLDNAGLAALSARVAEAIERKRRLKE